MQTFFKRLLQIIDFEGFKNINDFALNGLKYESSSKLNRLKDDKNKPSVEIILDIANYFPNINTHWLLTGKGNMLLNKVDSIIKKIEEPSTIYKTDSNEQLFKNFVTLKENIALKDAIIESLKEKIEIQEKQIIPFESMLKEIELRIGAIEQFNDLIKHKLDIK